MLKCYNKICPSKIAFTFKLFKGYWDELSATLLVAILGSNLMFFKNWSIDLYIEKGERFQDATMRLPMCQVGPNSHKIHLGWSICREIFRISGQDDPNNRNIQSHSTFRVGNMEISTVFLLWPRLLFKKTYISRPYAYILPCFTCSQTNVYLFWCVLVLWIPHRNDVGKLEPGSCCRSINFARIRLKIVRASSETWTKPWAHHIKIRVNSFIYNKFKKFSIRATLLR